MNSFKIKGKTALTTHRRGTLTTRHGVLKTPFFMSIGTRGAVKTLAPQDLLDLKAPIVLSNTYHLIQRPSLDVLKKHRGLHSFMGWDKPILTDSGGYQVFSLGKFRKITDEGVTFQSEIDGRKIHLTPESVIDAQLVIGSDIIMILDECPPWPCSYEYAKKSLATTLAWAQRSKDHFEKMMKKQKVPPLKRPLLFGIVQGSTFKDLREESAHELQKIGFDGYAIGGVAVGEPKKEMLKVLQWTTPLLPADKPRYLMGVGKPDDIVDAVLHGVDMFDCVIPTREARHGKLYIRKKASLKKNFYSVINIKNEQHKNDLKPVDVHCSCYACKHFSRSYLRHLFSVKEPLAHRLATIHNLNFYLRMMEELQG
ncbi:MAG: tRNA guanosine(34) transglycosylase Tgt [bacterium]|nr:tRNA guanosine(34) transglycosylase Tgt [bacterium]